MVLTVETLTVSPVLVEEQEPELEVNKVGSRVVGFSISRNGSCETSTTYLEGYHPHRLGRFHQGKTGEETAIDRVAIKPVRTFMVEDSPPPLGLSHLAQAKEATRILDMLGGTGLIPNTLREKMVGLRNRIEDTVRYIEDPDSLPDIRDIVHKKQP